MAGVLQNVPAERTLKLTLPGEKLLVPQSFKGDATLDSFIHHDYLRGSKVKDKFDQGIVEWATPNMAFALLKNADSFWVDVKDAIKFHGGAAVVKTALFSDNVSEVPGYSADPDVLARERNMKSLNLNVQAVRGRTATESSSAASQPPNQDLASRTTKKPAPLLSRFALHGDKWTRRRYTLYQDEEFSFIQWMDTKAAKLKEKPSSVKLCDIELHIRSIEAATRSCTEDMVDIKSKFHNYTTLVETTHSLSESLRDFVRDQKSMNTAIMEELTKLRTDVRNSSLATTQFLSESLRDFVRDQKSMNTAIMEELTKLRTDVRN